MNLAGRIKAHFMDAFRLADDAADSLVATSRVALAQTLAKLGAALDCANSEEACHWAHCLKGNLLNAGLPELAEEAASIEAMTVEPPVPVGAAKGKLREIFTALEPFLTGDGPIES